MPATTTTAPTTTTTHPPTTTTAPPATTTAPAATTTAPAATTTAPAATTTAPAATTTAPAATTTAPGTTTTAAPGSTTTGAPGSTTTGAPGSTTTAAGGSGNPEISSVQVTLDPDDGAEHHDHSVEVSTDVKLTLKWETSGATSMHIEGLGDFDASGEQEVPAKNATYTLIAKGDGGSESTPWPLEVHTHDPSEVVSPHTEVGSGVAAIVSFQATKDDNPVTAAKVGDALDLVIVVSDATESAKVADQDCELTDTGDGHKTGKVSVTIADGDSGSYEAQAIKDGNAADTKQIQVDIGAGVTTTTTAPGGTTTAAPGTTTTAPGTTTTKPGTTTTAPGTTTTAGGDWTAAWSAETAKEGDTVQMVLTAPGLKAGTEVSFEVKMDGIDDPIATVKANSEDGKASADFKDWFKPDVIKDLQAVDADNGEKFQEAKFSFKASVDGGKDASTTAPCTYADSIEVQLVDEQNQPVAKTKVLIVSPFGFASITSDDQGNVKLEGLPPGGAHVTID